MHKKIYPTLFFISIYAFSLFAWEFKIREYFIKPKTKIVIKKETENIVKYIKTPVTKKDYSDAYYSPIIIKTKMLNDTQLYILASDNWKQTEKQLTLESQNKFPWKPVIIIGGISFCIGGALTGILMHNLKK